MPRLKVPKVKVSYIDKRLKRRTTELHELAQLRLASTFYGVEGKTRVDDLEQRIINHLNTTSALLTILVDKNIISVEEAGLIIGERLTRKKKLKEGGSSVVIIKRKKESSIRR